MEESNIPFPGVTKKMLQEGVHVDVTLNAGDGGTAKAHRCILATRSPVIEAMFRSNMKERRTSVVELQDMKLEVIKLFLLAVYCGFDEIEGEAILDEHWK
jgi:speckle-type POZ protein